MDKQRLQDELDNLKLFVLPEVEGRLADVLAMQEDDPDWEYREQDVQQAREELADVRSRIANIEAHLTQRVPDNGNMSEGEVVSE